MKKLVFGVLSTLTIFGTITSASAKTLRGDYAIYEGDGGEWRGYCTKQSATGYRCDAVFNGPSGKERTTYYTTVTVTGNSIRMVRSGGDSGLKCIYTGTLQNNNYMAGQYYCPNYPPLRNGARWSGRYRGDLN